MDDFKLVLQKFEAADHGASDSGQDMLGNTLPGQGLCIGIGGLWGNLVTKVESDELVQAASIHVFHAVVNAGLYEEGTVEVYDVNRTCRCAMKDIEFHDDGVELCTVEFEVYFLLEWGALDGGRGRKEVTSPSWPSGRWLACEGRA
jgi:hypothetical protein